MDGMHRPWRIRSQVEATSAVGHTRWTNCYVRGSLLTLIVVSHCSTTPLDSKAICLYRSGYKRWAPLAEFDQFSRWGDSTWLQFPFPLLSSRAPSASRQRATFQRDEANILHAYRVEMISANLTQLTLFDSLVKLERRIRLVFCA